MGAIHLKRAYDPAAHSDGRRILDERLWPRGIRKADLVLDEWLKDVAPSTELRKWFGHDPERWIEFRKRYFDELKSSPAVDAVRALLASASKGTVTLVFSSHDLEHNNAAALKAYLERRMRRSKARSTR
jgi:uncharacterized protein YeaO (DUF488 family)